MLIINYWRTDSRQHFTIKSHLILVDFNLVFYLFQIKRDRFYLIFPTYIQFCTHILVLYFLEPFQKPTFLADLKNSAHMLISSLSTVFQVNTNKLTSKIDEGFHLCQKSLDFWIITEQSSYRLISLSSNRIYDIFIADRSYKDLIRNVSNTFLYFHYHMHCFDNQSIDTFN